MKYQLLLDFHKMNYVETSAKTGYNVETMFLSATEEALGYMDRGLYSDPCLRILPRIEPFTI